VGTDDPARGRVSAAWGPFEAALARALAVLEDEQYLVLSVKHTGYFVQFAAEGAAGLRAEAVANAFLSPGARLDEARLARLAELGWRPPTHTLAQIGTAEADPDGSVNHYRDWAAPVPVAEAAALAVRTLREVYGVDHPRRLEYRAFDADGEHILIPTLAINRAHDEPRGATLPEVGLPPGMDLQGAVIATMKRVLGVDELHVDEDGDIPVRHGSAAVYVRALEDPPTVVVYSPLVFDVTVTPALYEELNRLNGQTSFARFLLVGTTVMCSAEVFAHPFVADDVVHAYVIVSRLADEMDDDLAERFGGTVAFREERPVKPPVPAHQPPGAGGYL
jgi:hypothetical protein